MAAHGAVVLGVAPGVVGVGDGGEEAGVRTEPTPRQHGLLAPEAQEVDEPRRPGVEAAGRVRLGGGGGGGEVVGEDDEAQGVRPERGGEVEAQLDTLGQADAADAGIHGFDAAAGGGGEGLEDGGNGFVVLGHQAFDIAVADKDDARDAGGSGGAPLAVAEAVGVQVVDELGLVGGGVPLEIQVGNRGGATRGGTAQGHVAGAVEVAQLGQWEDEAEEEFLDEKQGAEVEQAAAGQTHSGKMAGWRGGVKGCWWGGWGWGGDGGGNWGLETGYWKLVTGNW